MRMSAIAQDTFGFMWLGTVDGLNRYDGYEFKTYRHDPNDPNTLSHSRIRALYSDRSGMLWIGTEKGLTRYDPGWRHSPDIPTPPLIHTVLAARR